MPDLRLSASLMTPRYGAAGSCLPLQTGRSPQGRGGEGRGSVVTSPGAGLHASGHSAQIYSETVQGVAAAGGGRGGAGLHESLQNGQETRRE